MVKKFGVGLVLLVIVALAIPAAYAQDGGGLAAGPEYWPTEGWRTAIPEEQGVSSATLAALVTYVQDEHMPVDSITVIHNGYVVLDTYFHPARPTRRHELYSVTKSFTSTLIGIAIDQGHIAGVDEPVLSFFPDREIANVDADKQAMTLAHLLTMTSGLECDDSQYDTLNAMQRSGDYVQFALDLPMMEAPGTRFNYCNAVSHLLAAILVETTGRTPREYADAQLFGPLG
ncbi:MAG: beta-lactamase family protein, partial [Anaerolineae bacterium]|nr:beta-lactamase family protein [Anaerolineae bacterium]